MTRNLEETGSIDLENGDILNWEIDFRFEHVSPDDPPRLTFIDSIHEQREFNKMLMPVGGSWVEVGDFEPIIETWDLKERWKCLSAESYGPEEEGKLLIKLKKLDHEAMKRECEPLVEQIISKHKRKLLDSLRIAIVRGLFNKSGEVDQFVVERAKARINNQNDKKAKKEALLAVDRRQAFEAAKDKLAKQREKLKQQEELVAEIEKEIVEDGYDENKGKRKVGNIQGDARVSS